MNLEEAVETAKYAKYAKDQGVADQHAGIERVAF
jgi:hypothetical protein